VYLRMYVSVYLTTLSPYGDNHNVHACRQMMKSNMQNSNDNCMFDNKINEMKT